MLALGAWLEASAACFRRCLAATAQASNAYAAPGEPTTGGGGDMAAIPVPGEREEGRGGGGEGSGKAAAPVVHAAGGVSKRRMSLAAAAFFSSSSSSAAASARAAAAAAWNQEGGANPAVAFLRSQVGGDTGRIDANECAISCLEMVGCPLSFFLLEKNKHFYSCICVCAVCRVQGELVALHHPRGGALLAALLTRLHAVLVAHLRGLAKVTPKGALALYR